MAETERRPRRVLVVGTDDGAASEAEERLSAASEAGERHSAADGAVESRTVIGLADARPHLTDGEVDCVVVASRDGAGDDADSVVDTVDDIVGVAPSIPSVLVCEASAATTIDDALAAGVDDCIGWEAVETTPLRFARRVAMAADAGRHRRGDVAAEPYRHLFEQVPDPAAIIQDGVYVAVNERTLDLFEAERDAIIGMDAFQSVPESERPEVGRRFRALLEGETDQVPYVDREITTFAGENKHIRVSSGRITYRGRPAILITARDVTERREREQRLLSYETMVETIGDVVYTLDEDYYFDIVAGAAEAVTGYTSGELEGSHLSLLLSEEDIERGKAYRQQVIDEEIETGSIEARVHRKDGSTTPVEFRYRRLPAEGEAFQGTAGVFRDIGRRKQRERRLRRQNDRLEEFAGIVSHDLRNPLNVASGHLDLARADCDSDHLDAVGDALQRMETLIEDTLTLARQGKAVAATERIDLEETLQTCWTMVETANATLEVGAVGAIEADPERLRQLFENLFRNAVEHGGAAVTVTVGPMEGGFFVADDGGGIPVADREQVLQPGYSTGEGGSGFGLAIVQTIAAAHEWGVAVTESADGGARFEFTGVEAA